jgi:heme-degrading monooxygenase HmoA
MFVRLWHLNVSPAKVDEFMQAVQSLLPAVRQQWGFRGLLVLRSDSDAKAVQVLALWETLEALRSSEKNMLFYQAMMRLKACAEGFPSIHEHQVLVSDLPAARSAA